jgi:hypothetical protein|nr:MFS transporter [Serratia fonticola]
MAGNGDAGCRDVLPWNDVFWGEACLSGVPLPSAMTQSIGHLLAALGTTLFGQMRDLIKS